MSIKRIAFSDQIGVAFVSHLKFVIGEQWGLWICSSLHVSEFTSCFVSSKHSTQHLSYSHFGTKVPSNKYKPLLFVVLCRSLTIRCSSIRFLYFRLRISCSKKRRVKKIRKPQKRMYRRSAMNRIRPPREYKIWKKSV
jgi:hypothetical protein